MCVGMGCACMGGTRMLSAFMSELAVVHTYTTTTVVVVSIIVP